MSNELQDIKNKGVEDLFQPKGFKDNEDIIPTLNEWNPSYEELYFVVDDDVVKAKFDKILDIDHDNFSTFVIKKSHFKKKMLFIVNHINYFINFYDIDFKFLMSLVSVKYIIDTNPKLSVKSFSKLINDRILTETFISRVKEMTDYLYTLDINTDQDGKFKSTPKITNEQARVIVAISFCMKLIFPLCVHFSNINLNLTYKKDYIPCFDKIFMNVIHRFEKNDEEIYIPLCHFIRYRIDRNYLRDKEIWGKKKQLYGLNYETYLQELIHEIIIVKGLYKLEYNRSVVSFIDGILFKSYTNFKKENFPYKPIELSAENDGNDSDEYLSRAEAQEMAIYCRDESNMIINEVNNEWVINKIIKQKFKFEIDEDEFNFYKDNCKLNSMNQFLLQTFYSKYFDNSSSIYSLNKDDTIKLLIYMKTFLRNKGLIIVPQICTAIIQGKFKDNIIRNGKFKEKFQSSTVYQDIIKEKFKYIIELNPKEDIIIKKLSTIINSSFVVVDTNPEFNGLTINELGMDAIINEFLIFLSII